jgi:hypothetical protein
MRAFFLPAHALTHAQADGFVAAHAVRVLFPTPDHVYKGPLLHFEVAPARVIFRTYIRDSSAACR